MVADSSDFCGYSAESLGCCSMRVGAGVRGRRLGRWCCTSECHVEQKNAIYWFLRYRMVHKLIGFKN